jgi:hypothetical protein
MNIAKEILEGAARTQTDLRSTLDLSDEVFEAIERLAAQDEASPFEVVAQTTATRTDEGAVVIGNISYLTGDLDRVDLRERISDRAWEICGHNDEFINDDGQVECADCHHVFTDAGDNYTGPTFAEYED